MTVKGPHAGQVHRRVVGASVAGVAAGIVALAAAGAAAGQPPSQDPCSPAALMRAHAAAMNQMADYLDSHPDVQQAFIDARSRATLQEREAAIDAYVATHPEIAAALQSMHQPVDDLSASCGVPMDGMMPGAMGPEGMAPGQ